MTNAPTPIIGDEFFAELRGMNDRIARLERSRVDATGPVVGSSGATILNGSGAPSSGLGNNGDFYIDTVNERLYGPKSSGVWGTGVNLVGPAGSAGTPGSAGATGATGATGPAGVLAVSPPTNRSVAFATAYQPNTTKPTLVVLTSGGATGQVDVYMDATTNPSTRIAINGSTGQWNDCTFIVPAGYYYKLVLASGAPSLLYAQEYTLDAPPPGDWTEVALSAATSYSVSWLTGARTLELEIVGRESWTTGSAPFIMAKPSGTGITLNGRNVRTVSYINSVDGVPTSPTVVNDTATRDNGFEIFGPIEYGPPTDLIVRGTIDMLAGVSEFRGTQKNRDTTNSQVANQQHGGFLYSPPSSIPSDLAMLVQFNHAFSATFTGILRYRFR